MNVDLDVPAQAHVEAFLSQSPIERNDDGRHIPPFSEPTASGQAGTDWSTSFVLEPATTYHLLVRASDAQGQSAVAGTFTTNEAMGPDVLATPSPCLDGCLEDIRLEASDDGRSLSISIGSTVDVDVDLEWAQGPVIQTDDGPLLANPWTEAMSVDAGSRTTTTMNALTPHSTYSFIVVATDSFGSSDRWIATVATPSPLITAGIERVHISGDGDDGSWNRGEIGFDFGMRGDYWGRRGDEKLSSNSTVGLNRHALSQLRVDAFGRYPWIAVVASEFDGVGLCFLDADPGPDWIANVTVSHCSGSASLKYSQAYVPTMTLTEIEQLATCETYDIEWATTDRYRCAWASTSPNSSDQVSFEFLVWFDLEPYG